MWAPFVVVKLHCPCEGGRRQRCFGGVEGFRVWKSLVWGFRAVGQWDYLVRGFTMEQSDTCLLGRTHAKRVLLCGSEAERTKA